MGKIIRGILFTILTIIIVIVIVVFSFYKKYDDGMNVYTEMYNSVYEEDSYLINIDMEIEATKTIILVDTPVNITIDGMYEKSDGNYHLSYTINPYGFVETLTHDIYYVANGDIFDKYEYIPGILGGSYESSVDTNRHDLYIDPMLLSVVSFILSYESNNGENLSDDDSINEYEIILPKDTIMSVDKTKINQLINLVDETNSDFYDKIFRILDDELIISITTDSDNNLSEIVIDATELLINILEEDIEFDSWVITEVVNILSGDTTIDSCIVTITIEDLGNHTFTLPDFE